MTLEEAKKKLNQDLAKKRKGYLSENAYRQSPEGIKRSKDRIKAIGSAALDFTPYATYTDGKSAIKNFQKGEYLDSAIDAGFAGLGLLGLAPLAKGVKTLNQANKYRKFKNEAARRAGPLSPHYMEVSTGDPRMDRLMNQNIANMSMLPDGTIHPLEQRILRNKNLKDKHIFFSGQNPAVAKVIAEEGYPTNNLKRMLNITDNPDLARKYDPKNMMMFIADKDYFPPVPKTKITDNLTTSGGGQWQMPPEKANEFLDSVDEIIPNFDPNVMELVDPDTGKVMKQTEEQFKKYLKGE